MVRGDEIYSHVLAALRCPAPASPPSALRRRPAQPAPSPRSPVPPCTQYGTLLFRDAEYDGRQHQPYLFTSVPLAAELGVGKMKVTAELLSAPSCDTGRAASILIHFDTKRYLLGHVSEGSLRAFLERRSRLARIGDVFLSGRTEWASVGGLLGLVLTLGDQDGPKRPLRVHGGENLMHTVATGRAFVFRKAMDFGIHETLPGEEFSDENLSVRTLHVQPEKKLEDSVNKEAESLASGCKRSFDELLDDTSERKHKLAKVVSDMFCSNWTMNSLEDLPEGEVNTGGRLLRRTT